MPPTQCLTGMPSVRQYGTLYLFKQFERLKLQKNIPLWTSPECIPFQRDSCLAIIPNACSAKLQPLHQGLKEKFKVSFLLVCVIGWRESWINFISEPGSVLLTQLLSTSDWHGRKVPELNRWAEQQAGG